jgi:hypothetical protein
VCGAGQHGTSNHDDVVRALTAERFAELLGNASEVCEVQAAIPTARSRDRYERDVARLNRLARIGRRAQPSSLHRRLDELAKAWFDDGALAGVQHGYFRWIDIDADDRMPIVGKRCR